MSSTKLSVGIVGLPNVGKSTLFNALTKNSVPADNYPFCTIDPSVGVVAVPDTRLETLSKISNSEQTIPAIIEFVDIAGLVRGAASGEGLGNQFLSHIREVDMILEVVRIFDNSDIHHVSGLIDPLTDIEVINLELIMSDLSTINSRLHSLDRELKKGSASAKEQQKLLIMLKNELESGKLVKDVLDSEEDRLIIKEMNLLTTKPFLYACNKQSGGHNLDEQNGHQWQDLLDFFDKSNSEYVCIDAGMEHELKDLSNDDKQEFRREYGNQNNGIDELIRTAYKYLGLISFFTTGEKETRAWTINQGSSAPQAGSAIHSDFHDKFIRAQVVSYEDLVMNGSLKQVKEAGKVRTEGKEYIVKDGDVIEFLHS